ncbi:MAG: hypothetical protein QXT73_01335 [Candidatus Methanomethylicaceae archaeon]
MTLRTFKPFITIEEFKGVSEVIEPVALPPPFVENTLGGFPTQQGSFKRIYGKRAIDNTTRGSVLTIATLEFNNTPPVVLSHASVVYEITSDLSGLKASSSPRNYWEVLLG